MKTFNFLSIPNYRGEKNEGETCPWQHWKHKKSIDSERAQAGTGGGDQLWPATPGVAEEPMTLVHF